MNIYPVAAFKSGFPDDSVEEDGDIVIFPGRGIAEALAGLLRDAGLSVDAPEHQHEHGWDFTAHVDGVRIWVQISDIGDVVFLSSEPPYAFFKNSRKKRAAHGKLLTLLDQGMRKDKRFSRLRWLRRDEGETDKGRPAPVEA